MATRPDKLPEWATVDEIDPVSGQSNVVEPPPERKESGWTRREIPPRQWFNWLARTVGKWIEWARDEIDALDGRVTTNESDLSDATNLPTANELARRDASGRMRAADPVDEQDVVTKGYIESDGLPAFYVRAWAIFDDSGVILGSGNISSVTRNSIGDYSVSFSTNMPDSNYCITATTERFSDSDNHPMVKEGSVSVSGFDILISNTTQSSDTRQDAPVFLQVVR